MAAERSSPDAAFEVVWSPGALVFCGQACRASNGLAGGLSCANKLERGAHGETPLPSASAVPSGRGVAFLAPSRSKPTQGIYQRRCCKGIDFVLRMGVASFLRRCCKGISKVLQRYFGCFRFFRKKVPRRYCRRVVEGIVFLYSLRNKSTFMLKDGKTIGLRKPS